MALINAEPYPFDLDPTQAALIIIDMQRDFLEPGGFGAALGNDVSLLRRTIAPCRQLLAQARLARLTVIHTREGHRPDLADLPPTKKARGRLPVTIGDPGPMGRILVRGEDGHDIISELYPVPGEPIVDKPGKGAFHATDLDSLLKNRGIAQLIVCGVTTEVCVHTTVREANDRGYECVVAADCVGSYFPEFHEIGLRMIAAQGGIFGWVASSADIIPELAPSDGERIVDKPVKGTFCATDFELMLRLRGIANLVLTGITTDVCVHTTMREADDRGFECLLLEDCCGAIDRSNHDHAIKMIKIQGRVFGAVATSKDLLELLGG